jgi:hypothetical protein
MFEGSSGGWELFERSGVTAKLMNSYCCSFLEEAWPFLVVLIQLLFLHRSQLGLLRFEDENQD